MTTTRKSPGRKDFTHPLIGTYLLALQVAIEVGTEFIEKHGTPHEREEIRGQLYSLRFFESLLSSSVAAPTKDDHCIMDAALRVMRRGREKLGYRADLLGVLESAER